MRSVTRELFYYYLLLLTFYSLLFSSINVLFFYILIQTQIRFFIDLFICSSHYLFILNVDCKIIEPSLTQIPLIEAGQLQGSIGWAPSLWLVGLSLSQSLGDVVALFYSVIGGL